jgi:hypothetical protein
MKQHHWIRLILVVACILASSTYGVASLFLPTPVASTAPADQFSAGRAMQHVQALAQIRRVVGTPGMDQAVIYVTNALRACHLEPEIQSAFSPKGTLRNVVVRLAGTQAGNAILVVSHLDSISYGAGDNASGAAVLLEAACSLPAGEPLKNDLIILFEDGEEQGYLGGYAFAQSDPAMNTIRRVIGLDTAAWGPVVLLQTTPGNADLIRAYASSVSYPAAFGFYADADWTISQDDSEIQPFYERGIAGLEMEDPTAFTGKHTDDDTIQAVKAGSIQQMGDQLLALTRYLADSPLANSASIKLSYFSLWGIGVIHYPAVLNIVFAALSIAGLVFLASKQLGHKGGTGRSYLISIGILFLALLGSVLVGLIGTLLFSRLFPNPNPNTGSYLLPASLPYFLGVLLITGIGYLLLRSILAGRHGLPALRFAGLSTWGLLAIVTTILLPVGSYTFSIPLVIAMLISLIAAKYKLLGIIPAVLATMLITPNLTLAFISTGMETLALVALMLTMLIELWAGAILNLPARVHPADLER